MQRFVENTLSPGELANFHAAVIKALPHGIDPVHARYWTRKGWELTQQLKRTGALTVDCRELFSHCTQISVRLGKYQDVDEVERALRAKRYGIGQGASTMMRSSKFVLSSERRTVDLVVLHTKDLGLQNNPNYSEAFRKALKLGLRLCPPEIGPLLRLRWTKKMLGLNAAEIAMDRLFAGHDYGDCIFCLDGAGRDNSQCLSTHPGHACVGNLTHLVFKFPDRPEQE